MKTCKECKLTKEYSEFHKQKFAADGHRPECKDCRKRYTKEYRERRYAQSPDWELDARLRNLYGITLVEYNARVERQNGVCSICFRRPQSERLVVDHDHTTWKIRGLLCRNCNSGIGKLGDSVERLEAALRYLQMDLPEY